MSTMTRNTFKDYREARQTDFTLREALWAVLDLRGRLGWALGDAGSALSQLGHRLDEGVPGREDWWRWYSEGYARGKADRENGVTREGTPPPTI